MDPSPANIVDICNQRISGMDEDCSVSEMLISKVEPLVQTKDNLNPCSGCALSIYNYGGSKNREVGGPRTSSMSIDQFLSLFPGANIKSLLF